MFTRGTFGGETFAIVRGVGVGVISETGTGDWVAERMEDEGTDSVDKGEIGLAANVFSGDWRPRSVLGVWVRRTRRPCVVKRHGNFAKFKTARKPIIETTDTILDLWRRMFVCGRDRDKVFCYVRTTSGEGSTFP